MSDPARVSWGRGGDCRVFACYSVAIQRWILGVSAPLGIDPTDPAVTEGIVQRMVGRMWITCVLAVEGRWTQDIVVLCGCVDTDALPWLGREILPRKLANPCPTAIFRIENFPGGFLDGFMTRV